MKQLPNPAGCGRCGIDKRGHAIQVTSDGPHTWEAPSAEQIKERWAALRASRTKGDQEA